MIFIYIACILVPILLLTCCILYYFTKKTFARGPAVYDIEKVLKDEPEQLKRITEGREELRAMPCEEHKITSHDGLKLFGYLYRTKEKSVKYIICMHGYRSSPEDFMCAMGFFISLGYNVLTVNQRSHGKSEGKFITYGAYESRDVISWAEHINTIFPDGSLYITGVSMGATTVLMAIEQGLPTNVLGIIADCGFTSPAEIIKKVMKKDLKVPLFPFYYTTRAVTKLLTGFDFEEYSAVRAVRESKIPILFLHGKSDGFVPFYMGEEIYSAAACRKKAVWVEGADHGCSFLIDREGCTKALYGFLGI